MTEFIQYLVSGIALGSVYALVALGFVVIYRASEVFNFAHGELLTFGALFMVWLSSPPVAEADLHTLGMPEISGMGIPFGIAVLLSVVTTGLIAVVIERFALRPLVGRPVFVPIIITLFIGFIMRTVMILVWGTGTMPLTPPWNPMDQFNVLGATIDYNAASVVLVSVIVLGLFFLMLRNSRLGIAMRATSSDQETALGLGIPVGKVFAVTWFIAGAFAALAGIFVGIREPSIDAGSTGFIALRAFPAVILGGLESPTGAVIAGLLLGILEVLTQGYINDSFGMMSRSFHAVLPYLVMIIVLMVRPYGLFGKQKVERL